MEVIRAYHGYMMSAATWNTVAAGILKSRCRPPPPPPEPREARTAAIAVDEDGLCSELFPSVGVDTGISWLGTSYAIEVDCTEVKLEFKRAR